MTTAAAPAVAVPGPHAVIGLCLDCNYPVLDLPPHRCAECGRGFDPADRNSFNTGRPVPAYARWATGPISWPVSVVTLAGLGVTLWRARLPHQPFTWAAPAVWGWAVIAGIWLAWPLVRRGVLRHYGWPPRVIRPMGRGHWVVPAVAVIVATAVGLRAPPRAAFVASRGAMDRLAADVTGHPGDVFRPQRVGAFWANHIETVSGGMSFVVDDRDVRDRVGFARLPPGRTPTRNMLHVTRAADLGGGWWSWKQGV